MAEISLLLADILGGYRLTESEAARLLNTRGRDTLLIASAADEMRELRTGNVVTYVRNQNLHVTNICKNLCGFCGFGRSTDDLGLTSMIRRQFRKKRISPSNVASLKSVC
jgi:FO synthase subunit 2